MKNDTKRNETRRTLDVGDVVVGSVLGNSSQRANECRIAMFLAGKGLQLCTGCSMYDQSRIPRPTTSTSTYTSIRLFYS